MVESASWTGTRSAAFLCFYRGKVLVLCVIKRKIFNVGIRDAPNVRQPKCSAKNRKKTSFGLSAKKNPE